MIHVVVRPRRAYLERGEHLQQLNCDFTLESRAAQSLRLDTIEVSVLDAQQQLVVRRALDTNALNPSIETVGATALAPGESLTVFNRDREVRVC